MRRKGIVVAMLLAGLLALPAATQPEEGTIAQIFFVKPSPGWEQQLEEGAKKHVAWHRQQKDTWTWYAWQYVTGENTGMYGYGTFGHRWEDFDNPAVPADADLADYRNTVAPYVESTVSQFYAVLPKVSQPWEGVAALEEILVFQVKYGKEREFNFAIRKFHEAIQKTKWPVHYEWYALVNGGEHPTYVLVLPRTSWAAFKPLEKSFVAMLEEAYGHEEAHRLLESFDAIVRSLESSIIRDRADLSYIPAPAPAK